MSWIQRLFSNLRRGTSPTPPTRRTVRGPRRARHSIECGRCGFRIEVRVPRCPRCGARVVWPGEEPRPAAMRTTPRRPTLSRVPSGLTHLQQRILAATRDADDGLIHVVPASGPDEGEIKAGATRVSGAQAVAAVDALRKTGMLSRVSETTFSLTVEGLAAAQELGRRES